MKVIARAASLLLASAALLAAACTGDPVVLATLPGGDAGARHAETRCIDADDCEQGYFCEKHDCGSPAGTCHPFPASCPDREEPVCGCDGITYFNECLRRAAGVAADVDGECLSAAVPCLSPMDCPEGGSCARLGGPDPDQCGPDLRGRCWLLPPTCPPPERYDLWIACTAPPPPGASPPPAVCVDTCTAIRTGQPHHRARSCP